MSVAVTDDPQAEGLLEAQNRAHALFAEIERSLIRPGIRESQLSDEIYALAAEIFGVETHWHKRVVRAGPNTLRIYNEDPPDLVIGEDDILFVDLGPVFAAWEADFGRTYVLGDDPAKHLLAAALQPVFDRVKAHYKAHPDMSCGALYTTACDMAREAGWEFGGTIAGHLVGEFPHEKIQGDKRTLYILPGNETRIADRDETGRKRHWILEIHLVDRERQIGGFFEELLTVG
jgi:Xaa-Pro aminopeptidase